jgi:hypothetical protein
VGCRSESSITKSEKFEFNFSYIANDQARTFLENAPISPTDKEKIAHGNAEKVLKLALSVLSEVIVLPRHWEYATSR